MLKYGTKKGLSWYFWARILKSYSDFLNEHSQFFLVAKCREKTKMPKFGTQNALFWYFCARILKHSCHIWNRHPHVFLVAEFCEKTKMPKNGSKNTLFEFFFWLEFENAIAIFEISTLKFVELHDFTKKQKSLNMGLKTTYLCVFRLQI